MNAPLRRAGVALIVLFGLLFLNLNWVQAYKADSYRTNPHNSRVLLSDYERQRGSIAVGGGQVIVAKSVATTDELKYQRQYPFGLEYASITGYKPVAFEATDIESVENDFLSGNSPSLFGDRIKEMFTGNKATGGNVLLTISKAAQDTAYNDLTKSSYAKNGAAAVGIDPKTGAILAMVSTPSYDPNPLVSHDTNAAIKAYNTMDGNDVQPLVNRATQQNYPPGSTFKVIDSAAALSSGQYTPDTVIPAGPTYVLPGTNNVSIHNAESTICPDPTITLLNALTVSCNTGFAQLGVKLGADALKKEAQAFGFEDSGLTIAGKAPNSMPVAASHTGTMANADGSDDPAQVAQSSIGQRDVKMTPLEGCLIAATVANDGTQMRPYLIDKLQAPDLTNEYSASPSTLRTPVNSQVAGYLQTMMESVVQNGTGKKAAISGFQVGGKTGTAQNAEDDGDHGWFIGFVMKNNQPIMAVSVFLNHAGTGGSGEAARIAGDMMKAVIAERGLSK
jgi:peptidoglycan glycosyltransferase